MNPDVKIYFPKDLFWGASAPFDVAGAEADAAQHLPAEQRYFGGEREQFVFEQSGRFWGADVEFVDATTEIAPGITLVATTSPYMGYFTRYPSLGGVETNDDPATGVKTIELPELSLNLENAAGDVLLVGCSHSQVETIVRATREALSRPLGLVYGGYHMLPYTSEEIREVAIRMRDELGVLGVAPAHCSGHAAFGVFGDVFGERYRRAGLGTTTPFP